MLAKRLSPHPLRWSVETAGSSYTHALINAPLSQSRPYQEADSRSRAPLFNTSRRWAAASWGKMVLVYLGLLVFSIVIFLYNKYRKLSNVFKERGVNYEGLEFFFRNGLPSLMGKRHLEEVMSEFNESHKDEPLIGVIDLFFSSTLIVNNADYVEKILIKDFTHFTDHGLEDLGEKTQNPFDESLFTMNGNKWRAFRYKLSPMFTSGKLKNMFSSMELYKDRLNEFLKGKRNKEYEIKEAARLFSMDINGSLFFGIDANGLKNPDSEYSTFAKKAVDIEKLDILRFFLIFLLPGFVVRLFGLSVSKKEVTNYFSNVVKETFLYRKRNNIIRNDVIQLLLQLKEKNKIEISSWDSNDDYLKSDQLATLTDSFEVTDDIITVQAFSFLIGGFDPVALAMMYTFFELSQHPEIQEKARLEVFEQVKLHSGLTYESLKNMSFLENIIKETLRLHPIIPTLLRSCTKDYTFPNSYTIRKGERLQIPSFLIHRNSNYYDEPELFKPERFEAATKPGAYLPFGDGPRVCLAMRYALLLIKTGISSVVMNYKIKLNPKTELPLRYKTPSFFLIPKEELLFDLEEIV